MEPQPPSFHEQKASLAPAPLTSEQESSHRPVPVDTRSNTAGQDVDLPVHAPDQVIAQIGTIIVTSTMVRTPTGDFALRGSTWRIQDSTHIEHKIPGWAIAVGIIFAICTAGLSLLLLIIHETHYTGAIEVTTGNQGRQYTARIPVTSAPMIQALFNQVNHVQALASQG